jgi:hypothetical protein
VSANWRGCEEPFALEAIYDHGRDDFAVVERRGKVAIVERQGTALAAPSERYPFSIDHHRKGELSDRWDQPVCSICGV